MAIIDVKKMADCAVQFGHKTQKWNPRMAKYIYGEKNGIHIFDLDSTAMYLEKALSFLTGAAKDGKRFLLVSTKPQSTQFVLSAAEKMDVWYVVRKWIPGLLTNFDTLKKRIKYLRDIKKMKAEGELDKYTKKEASKMLKEVEKLEMSLGGVEEMKELPDVLISLDVVRDRIAVEEANRIGIPVVGICDTNADPGIVDFPIPGNDDAVKSIEYFIGLLSEAVISGTVKKKTAE